MSRETVQTAWDLYIERLGATPPVGTKWETSRFTLSEADVDLDDDRFRTLVAKGRRVGVVIVVTYKADAADAEFRMEGSMACGGPYTCKFPRAQTPATSGSVPTVPASTALVGASRSAGGATGPPRMGTGG